MEETKDTKVLYDENRKIRFDFSKALNIFEPHELASMYSDYITDVDFVIEENQRFICLEYKNANIQNAANPKALGIKLSGEEFWKKAAKKFYGTLFLIWACDRNPAEKLIQYVLLMEVNPGMDYALKKRFTAKMMKQLPFDYGNRDEIKREVIDSFMIVDLAEWETAYPQYPVNIV